eukprot:jgi/Ulvmu1/11303/UM074_0018.1
MYVTVLADTRQYPPQDICKTPSAPCMAVHTRFSHGGHVTQHSLQSTNQLDAWQNNWPNGQPDPFHTSCTGHAESGWLAVASFTECHLALEHTAMVMCSP